jgi:hypothetical protein
LEYDVKINLKEIGQQVEDSIHLADEEGPMTSFCAYGNYISGSIISGKYL